MRQLHSRLTPVCRSISRVSPALCFVQEAAGVAENEPGSSWRYRHTAAITDMQGHAIFLAAGPTR